MAQDMNFPDFDFRFDRRYMDDSGQSCRDYVFRSRSNPTGTAAIRFVTSANLLVKVEISRVNYENS